MDLIDFIFDQIVLMLYKEEFNDKFINLIEKSEDLKEGNLYQKHLPYAQQA